MCIIYIPGFGEKANIFDKIAPYLRAETSLFIDNWEMLGNIARKDINVLKYAAELAETYQITSKDVIIGHSMGGWIGLHIKHLTNCGLIQIASWTNPDRVVLLLKNPYMLYFCTKIGLIFNRFTKQYAVNRGYKDKPSLTVFVETFERLRKGNKNNIINQLRVILTPVKEEITVIPDMLIHAKADKIIRFPKETCHVVSGDHFTLYTQPEEVYTPILAWLRSRSFT